MVSTGRLHTAQASGCSGDNFILRRSASGAVYDAAQNGENAVLEAVREDAAPFGHEAALKACAGGDAAALRAIYEAEAAAMLGVALRIVRRRDLAEDVVQEAFVQIWRKAGQFDPALGTGRSWMFAIVRNRALNLVRNRSREDFVGDEALEDLAENHQQEDLIERMGEGEALRLCLQALDRPRRQSLVLAYAGGFSHGEIAGRLGVPLGTVKAWIRRSLHSLRECMT
jgi:RNA polymerase sigma-70 factor, ECF subfamily